MKGMVVSLKQGEVVFLKRLVSRGRRSVREVRRAHILLLANKGKRSKEIVDVLDVHRSTVARVKKRYLEEGLMAALKDKPRPGQPRKYTGRHEAEIIALACSSPPEGRRRWTIRLLAEEVRKKPGFETINRESIRLVLKKHGLSLG
jgi:transposase